MARIAQRIAAVTTLAAAAFAASAGTALAPDGEVPEPSTFTSMFTAMATSDMVVNPDGAATPGEEGGTGTFHFRINSDEEIICYDISLDGVTPPYQSPARTATHIHEAAEGASGPPRLAFPNPEDTGDGTLRSEGCMQGPFTTGVMANGADTGAEFSLRRIEADPSAFFADTHTAAFTAGAVRGQLTSVPTGGVETGAGGTAAPSWAPGAIGVGVLSAAAAVGIAARRRTAR
jgi:hypothetical protein